MRTLADNIDLTPFQARIANDIRDWLRAHAEYDAKDQGSVFWAPEAWKERGESYGCNSVLVLVHDGGALAPCCNWDYDSPLREAFSDFLETLGLYCEQCTSWYSAIYRSNP